MVIENGNKPADVARMFDIHRSQIDRWVAQFRDDTGEAFPGNGNRKPSDEELRRLRQENAELKQERDILKKSSLKNGDLDVRYNIFSMWEACSTEGWR